VVAYLNLSNPTEQYATVTPLSPANERENIISEPAAVEKKHPPLKFSKDTIRSSLKASTGDGIFAAMFTSVTTGVLLSNFLLQLGASPVEIGMISSIPMMVNLLQPLGAYLAERSTSRQLYGFYIFGLSRLLWLILALGIAFACWHHTEPHQLVIGTLVIVLFTNLMSALGSPSWLSWMAALVPQKLRGRYFGFRNSATNLTNLIAVPLLGLAVSAWPGGTIQGYGVALLLGVIAGLISLGYQFLMADVNPQEQAKEHQHPETEAPETFSLQRSPLKSLLEPNFLRFLLYFGFWTFAVNISSPFFNLYLLDDLGINVSWVTLYGSLSAGASLLMLVIWGKLADRFGNRPLLIFVGVLVAVTPLLWIGSANNALYLWIGFPLLHSLSGGTWAAIDLCTNNLQMSVAPKRNQSAYFAIAAAVAGVSGALGATAGGFLAEFANYGGLPGLFALSAVLRLLALLPLVCVHEQRSQPLAHVVRSLVLVRPRFLQVQVVANRAE